MALSPPLNVTTMITVVHIITALGSGGAERMLHLVASRSAGAQDIRQVVVSLSNDGIYGAELRQAGIEVECLGMRRGRAPFLGFVRLVRLLRRLRPDVVMTWLYHADLLGTLAGRAAGQRRIIWNLRCSDMDFAHHAPLTRWIVTVLAWLSPLPYAIASNSNAGRRAHEVLGYRPKRWAYLPNGFDTNEWKPVAADRAAVRRELGFSATEFVVGMVARVDPQKDHANFLEAARILATRYPHLRVLLIGRGTNEMSVGDELRPRTVALGERRDVPRLMRALDLLVSSSAYGEGFPNVIGEAMASGVPCVATDVGDAAIIIGEVGTVVPRRDPVALAAAIERDMSGSADALQALAARARSRVMSEFSIDRCLKRYDEHFKEAAADMSPPQGSQPCREPVWRSPEA